MATRCEDFPCCGHYDDETGEIFCYEANRTPEQKQLDEAIARAVEEFARAIEAKERRIRYDNAPEEHDEEKCEGWDGVDANPCKECIAAEYDAEEQDEYDRRHFYLDPQW